MLKNPKAFYLLIKLIIKKGVTETF